MGILAVANRPISDLQNIGKTLAFRLQEIGVTTEADLKAMGSAQAYRKLSANNPGRHLPVCYYLYSLEGAIQGKHWDDFSEQERTKMRKLAGLEK